LALRLILENAAKDVLLIRVRGAIDLATMTTWEDLIRRIIKRRMTTVIVDVGKLEYVSARGLKMLLALAANQSLMHGLLIVVGAHGPMHRIATMVGLWEWAEEATSVRAALQKADEHQVARSTTRDLTKETVRSSKRMSQQSNGK
jgi:anti-anti-sigma factor